MLCMNKIDYPNMARWNSTGFVFPASVVKVGIKVRQEDCTGFSCSQASWGVVNEKKAFDTWE